MSPTNRTDADVVVFYRGDLPLERAWERLHAQMPQVKDYFYLWSETQTGKLEHLHHFKNYSGNQYLHIEA